MIHENAWTTYTKKDLADQLIEAAQYSFSTRLSYLTLLGYSELDGLALEFLEAQVLKLPSLMNHPLSSSFTQSGEEGEVGQGRDPLPDDEVSTDGDRSRNR